MAVQLQWVGLACFLLRQEDGSAIAMDPYDPAVVAAACGIADPAVLDFRLEADTVIVSSLTDQAHAYHQAVAGEPRVINALDVAQGREERVNDEPLYAVQAAEAPHHPEGPDDNALYAFRAGGLWFLHMGDLGYGLDAEQLAPFAGRCDVLLALTGEGLTLTLDELEPMIDILSPTWIVPMHYNLAPVSGQKRVMTKIDAFLERRPRDPIIYPRHHTVTFPLPASELGRPSIVLLEPSGYQPS
jgi:L-ascorbate metabolism protein UlaG (beta-lactamase superfamily)